MFLRLGRGPLCGPNTYLPFGAASKFRMRFYGSKTALCINEAVLTFLGPCVSELGLHCMTYITSVAYSPFDMFRKVRIKCQIMKKKIIIITSLQRISKVDRVMWGPSRKTYLYNFDPRKPHFYIVKLGFTGVYIIILISAQKHRLWVLVRTASSSTHNLCFEQKDEKYQNFYLKIFRFWR